MTLRRQSHAVFRRAILAVTLLTSAMVSAESLVIPDASAATAALSSTYLNLRSAPATTSLIVMIVPPAVALTVNGEVQSGYFPVVYGERAGRITR